MKIYIVEGFDHVGKDYVINHNPSLINAVNYRPNYSIVDQSFTRNQSWIIGFSIFDLLSKLSDKGSEDILINRCIASSFVYDLLYNDGKIFGRHWNNHLACDLINWYKNNQPFISASHIYVSHFSRQTAYEIYQHAMKEKKLESLDLFKNFNSYWETYNLADAYYDSFYEMIDINPVRVENNYFDKKENR